MNSKLRPTFTETLWSSNFIIWWIGNVQAALGGALAGIALAYLVLEKTGSSGQLGLNLAFTLLPSLFSPLFGTFVDRLPIRVPLIVLNLLRAGSQLGVGWLATQHQMSVEMLHVAAIFNGMVAAFYAPASMGITPRLVPVQRRAQAVGVMQGSAQVMQLFGLVGGGVLVNHFGSGPSLIADGVTSLLFSLLLLFVNIPPRTVGTIRTSFRLDFLSGLRYVRSSPVLMLLPLQAFFINAALAPLEMLLPARMQALGVGASGFGLFLGFLTGGMAGGSLFLATLGQRVQFKTTGTFGFISTGSLFLLLALTTTPVQMYALAACCGVALSVLTVSMSLTFQTLVHQDYYGRVGSLLNTFGTIGIPVTLLALAPIADQMPLHLVFSLCGFLFLGSACTWRATMRRTPDTVILPPATPIRNAV